MNNDLFISPYMIGGLGNQMYMIAAAHSYSLDHDIPMIVNKVDKVPSYGNPRPTYWDTMFHKVNLQNITQQLPFIKETQLLHKINVSSYLDKYCQNVDYFHHNYESICDLFTLPQELENKVDCIYKNIVEKFNSNTVSVHVRKEDDSTANTYSFYREIMPIEFFISAMDQCEENTTFVVLTNNVEYCKFHFGKYKNIYYAEEEDYIELKLMSKCSNHIMPVSTFSWWGVYLNKNENKKIYVPEPQCIIQNNYKQKEFHLNFHKTLFQKFNNVIKINF